MKSMEGLGDSGGSGIEQLLRMHDLWNAARAGGEERNAMLDALNDR